MFRATTVATDKIFNLSEDEERVMVHNYNIVIIRFRYCSWT
jgi:hypothetical protein